MYKRALAWVSMAVVVASSVVGVVSPSGPAVAGQPTGVSPARAGGNGFSGLNPARLLDTREKGSTFDGQYVGAGKVGVTEEVQLPILGRGGLPATGVGAVALNVTATEASAASFITVFPTGQPRPTASNLNIVANTTVPNMVIVPIGAGGQISLYNNTGFTHLIVDVLGWFPPS